MSDKLQIPLDVQIKAAEQVVATEEDTLRTLLDNALKGLERKTDEVRRSLEHPDGDIAGKAAVVTNLVLWMVPNLNFDGMMTQVSRVTGARMALRTLRQLAEGEGV